MSRLPRKGFSDSKLKDCIVENIVNMVRQPILLCVILLLNFFLAMVYFFLDRQYL